MSNSTTAMLEVVSALKGYNSAVISDLEDDLKKWRVVESDAKRCADEKEAILTGYKRELELLNGIEGALRGGQQPQVSSVSNK